MYRSILVPIDISETDLTRHVVPQVQAHAKTAKVHFLAVIPTVPFYASLGLAYSTEFPDRSGLQAKASEKLEEIIKQFNIPAGESNSCRLRTAKGSDPQTGGISRRRAYCHRLT